MRRSWIVPLILFLRLTTIASCAGILYLEVYFFFKQERILLMFPWLAHHVSVEDLARNGKKYEGRWIRWIRWIRTEGIISSIREPTAILHAPGATGAESSIMLHNLPIVGIYTASLTSLTNEQDVEVVGEWETGPGAFRMLHLDVVGVTRPLQVKYLFSIIGVLALVPCVAVPMWIVFLPRRNRKNSRHSTN
jgi:hypothetical protein